MGKELKKEKRFMETKYENMLEHDEKLLNAEKI